ncbi:hypothetical protein R5R35_006991 [Gryllus longicercus]|uniref:Uncharacterized protein n=1 Tax=Gryllus longicercus TaxID=2509291 RepID=A0AAN9W0S9_9ORTH|nr:protein rolling stone [Gryllus bimaculatus]
MVNELWKREFRPHFFRVEHHKPHQFVLCQWQSQEEVHIGYFFYRWFMAAVFLISMICSICDVGRSADFGIKYKKWAIYLTNWGYTICTLQAILGASLITQQFLQQKRQGKYIPVRKRLPIGYQLYWVFHTIAVVLALGITVVYWATVYSPAVHCVVWVLFLLRRWVAVAMNKKSDPEASGDICQATSTSIQMDVVEC